MAAQGTVKHPTTSSLAPSTSLLHPTTSKSRTLSWYHINRARKGDSKTIEFVGSKSMGTKRASGQRQVKSSRKRQKTLQEPDTKLEPEDEQGQPKLPFEDQVFRFMDLPGELRNRVYEHAAEYAHRCFPPIFLKQKPKKRRGRSSGHHPLAALSSTYPPLRLPYIGLTQSCSLLRSEFRPMWLSTNKIPLGAIDGYLKIFFSRPDPRASPEARKRFENQYDPSGRLRIWVRKDELNDIDVTRVVKHVNRFPDYTVTFHSYPDIPATARAALEILVSNETPTWVKWIRNNTISQIRLMMRGLAQLDCTIRVVVKEQNAPHWMKAMLPTAVAPKHSAPFLEKMGLNDVQKEVKIHFGVDYS